MSYREADLKTELKKALEAAGHICWKIPDTARGVLKPCDMVALVSERFVAIECKLVKVGTASSPGKWHDSLIAVKNEDVRPHQHAALRRVQTLGGCGLLIVGIYDQHTHKREAYAFRYSDFRDREVWTYAACILGAVEIPWQRGVGWDIALLVGVIGTNFADKESDRSDSV